MLILVGWCYLALVVTLRANAHKIEFHIFHRESLIVVELATEVVANVNIKHAPAFGAQKVGVSVHAIAIFIAHIALIDGDGASGVGVAEKLERVVDRGA